MDMSGIDQEIKRRAIEALEPDYELVYVDPRDGLTAEQVDMLASCDMEGIWQSVHEWETDQRAEQAGRIRDEVVEQVIGEYVTDMGGERIDDYALIEGFGYSEEWHEIGWEIEDRDRSDCVRDLAQGTGQVLMRQVIANEDVALYGNHDTKAVWGWLAAQVRGGAETFPPTSHNFNVIESVLAESMHSLGYSMGMLVYTVDAADLYDSLGAEYVDIVNPYLYIGNYYNGDGFCSEEPLHGTFRVKRCELTTDRSAPGYGWDEVAGVIVSAYEAEIRVA